MIATLPDTNLVCTAGLLLGDAWMTVPFVRGLSEQNGKLRLICATYDAPVYRWAASRVVGCNWDVVEVFPNADVSGDPLCPGAGYGALEVAFRMAKERFPNEEIISPCSKHPFTMGSYYNSSYNWKPLDYTPDLNASSGYLTVHGYSRHDWKNCDNVVFKVDYSSPVLNVGLLSEPSKEGWHTNASFDYLADCVVLGKGMVGILSGWTNLAIIASKPQIIAAWYDSDRAQWERHPDITWLTKPSIELLQSAINTRGW